MESVQSQIKDIDQQIEMAKGTASTPSASNRSTTSSAGRAPMSALRTPRELFPTSAGSAAGNSKSDDDEDANEDDADADDDADDDANNADENQVFTD